MPFKNLPQIIFSKIFRAVVEFELIDDGDKILIGISGGKGIYGRYYTISGNERRYFYIESTFFGAKIGECPNQYRDEIPKVYILNF